MARAFILLRPEPRRRVEVFCSGLEACGYEVHKRAPRDANAGDILLVWNRRGGDEALAERFERAGGIVLVSENAYVDREGYAIARHKHNGGGTALINDPSRAERLRVELKPWRTSGDFILVAPNRFIGPRTDVMPEVWTPQTVGRLQRLTKRQVRVRLHPGNWKRRPPKVPIEEELRGAWACVIWWSTAGIRALLAGVPVIYCAPYWIGARAAGRDLKAIEAPMLGDRQAALRDIGNAQFTLEEISSGLPFRGLA
jgi:hypothetical protein